jgi:hypothetical protein
VTPPRKQLFCARAEPFDDLAHRCDIGDHPDTLARVDRCGSTIIGGDRGGEFGRGIGIVVPKLTEISTGRAATAASNRSGSLRITQSTKPIPNVPVTCGNSARSDDVDPAVPMPTIPSPPAAVTAAASRPPATPPMGALTIGTRRPMARDQRVDNT